VKAIRTRFLLAYASSFFDGRGLKERQQKAGHISGGHISWTRLKTKSYVAASLRGKPV
jgi:hypothetical protein